MNCSICKVNKIGPKRPPYGGFICGKEHLQCNDCNASSKGHCNLCQESTEFVQMNLGNNLAVEQTQMANSAMGKTPLSSSQSNSISDTQKSSAFLTNKHLLKEIEAQSNLSQEHLSLQDSKESLPKTQQVNKNMKSKLPTWKKSQKISTHELRANNEEPLQIFTSKKSSTIFSDSANEDQSKYFINEDDKNIRTLFMGTIPEEQSVSNFDYTSQNVYDIEINVEQQYDRKPQEVFETAKDSELNQAKFFVGEDDSNIIRTSEIRFTDSLTNFHSNSLIQNAANPFKSEQVHYNEDSTDCEDQNNEVKGHETLSINVLQSFEVNNTANNSEMVENYINTYQPVAFYHFPSYNCQHQNCDYRWQNRQQMQIIEVEQQETAEISNETEPSLQTAAHEVESSEELNRQDYLIMQSVGVTQPDRNNMALMDKFDRPSLDMRMQKVLETFQENPKIPKIQEKPMEKMKTNYTKMPTPGEAVTTKIPENVTRDNNLPQIQNTNNMNAVFLQLINSHRAYYQPSGHSENPICNLHTIPQPKPVFQEPPTEQFQKITCTITGLQELMKIKSRFLNNNPIPACSLNIPRSPIKCPESTCQRMIFVSDFNKHLVVDHNHLSMERIRSHQCKTFFLDPRLAYGGISKCHLLYLLRDKISNLGSSIYKDYLPLLVMTSRVSLQQLCGLPIEEQRSAANENLDYFIIWITGIVPEEFPVSVSLTVWPRSGKVPSCHLVYSGDMYSVRNSQQGVDVWRSGRMLLLSAPEIDLLTNGGKDMLNLQLTVQ